MQETVVQCYLSLIEFAEVNPVLTRRGHKMSFGYLYRLIRQDRAGELTRPLWFKYELLGEKEHIVVTQYST